MSGDAFVRLTDLALFNTECSCVAYNSQVFICADDNLVVALNIKALFDTCDEILQRLED